MTTPRIWQCSLTFPAAPHSLLTSAWLHCSCHDVQVLQLAEQILKNGTGPDQLLDSAHSELPASSQLAHFLREVTKQVFASPEPGQVLR